MTPPWAVWLFSLIHLIGCLTAVVIRTASLRPAPGQEISTFQGLITGKSEFDCVRECLKYSHCRSVAFFPSSKTCYLQPTGHVATAAGALAVTVWEIADAMCANGPSVTNGRVVPFNRNLTSVAGQVMCDADFIWTGNDAVVDCLSDETWTTVDGHCERYHWTNPVDLGRYYVPRPPDLTWKMCLTGIRRPWNGTGESQFKFSIYDSSWDVLISAIFVSLHTSSPTINLANRTSDVWGNFKDIPGVPLPYNREFLIEVSPASEHVLNIDVDGAFLGDYDTHISVTEIKLIIIYGDTGVEPVDLKYHYGALGTD